MDVQLQELIEEIKDKGIKTAESNASQIEEAAQKKAATIVEEAQNKANDLIKNAKAEIARLEKASEDAIAQASRNMLLSFRESLIAELNAFIKDETVKTYSSDLLKTLVPEIVKAWCKNNEAQGLEVLLSEKDCKALQSSLTGALKEQISKGLEIKPTKSIVAGFRIGINNGAAFYDYSADSLSELFASYLNPRVAKIMKSAMLEGK